MKKTKQNEFSEIQNELLDFRIAVDLTPMLPGAENGGAKLMTLELIQAMAECLPHTTFLLLTAESSHGEIDFLEQRFQNIQRMCILHLIKDLPTSIIGETAFQANVYDYIIAIARKIVPIQVKQAIKHSFRRTQPVPGSMSLLHQIKADLLFCPFTAPFYADLKIPTISVIYDLQYHYYPQFFSSAELFEREEAFKNAYETADHLVAISEFVRGTVIDTSGLIAQQVSAVPIGLFRDTKENITNEVTYTLLSKNKLEIGEYLLFPANFWEHKNHAMLLTAFGIFRKTHPKSKIKLVCTGAQGPSSEQFCKIANLMGLSDWVIYPGFVSPTEYDCLLNAAYALIFPSLYEGFGIPVLEAMASRIPVLCSNVTSLPEVGGDAVIYFDPRKPNDICNSITRLIEDPLLKDIMIEKGLKQAKKFENSKRMASQYVSIFRDVIKNHNRNHISGIFDDRWTSDIININFSASQDNSSRTLLIELENPKWTKIKTPVQIQVICCRKRNILPTWLINGKTTSLNIPLPKNAGIIEIRISPIFNPKKLKMNNDSRNLGLYCIKCEIINSTGRLDLFQQ